MVSVQISNTNMYQLIIQNAALIYFINKSKINLAYKNINAIFVNINWLRIPLKRIIPENICPALSASNIHFIYLTMFCIGNTSFRGIDLIPKAFLLKNFYTYHSGNS